MSNLDATIAKRFDITVKQNQTFDAVIGFFINEEVPYDLTGATPKLSIRKVASCSDECGCVGDTPFNYIYSQDLFPIIGDDTNELRFNDVIILSPGNYKYDLLITLENGKQYYFLTGTFKVKRSYTKNDT